GPLCGKSWCSSVAHLQRERGEYLRERLSDSVQGRATEPRRQPGEWQRREFRKQRLSRPDRDTDPRDRVQWSGHRAGLHEFNLLELSEYRPGWSVRNQPCPERYLFLQNGGQRLRPVCKPRL